MVEIPDDIKAASASTSIFWLLAAILPLVLVPLHLR